MTMNKPVAPETPDNNLAVRLLADRPDLSLRGRVRFITRIAAISLVHPAQVLSNS